MKPFHPILLTLFLLTGSVSIFSQTASPSLWQIVFGGEQFNGLKPNECPEELPSGLTRLKDGTYVVVGSSNDCARQDTNSKVEQKQYGAAWSAKIDANGNPVYIFLRVNPWIWKVIRSTFITTTAFEGRI
ncbi:hypothetical protein LEP1GSC052_3093 [Leptospira kmetyi serovar Malaysia str. Bejo-Iso9]|nr:hypothetical protein LEP1GSC052_3093 [Leptospira kmetyi serovar Malaysia str. Bejo-Iso9]